MARKKCLEESNDMRNGSGLAKAACLFPILTFVVFPARAENDALKRGYAIAVERCSHCHAISQDDIPPHAIVIPFRQLYTRFPIPMLLEARERGVIAGHDEMPMFSLTASDVRALLAYVDSLAPHAPGYNRNQE
jgi:mono/diheme cytochrome c family protein